MQARHIDMEDLQTEDKTECSCWTTGIQVKIKGELLTNSELVLNRNPAYFISQ